MSHRTDFLTRLLTRMRVSGTLQHAGEWFPRQFLYVDGRDPSGCVSSVRPPDAGRIHSGMVECRAPM